MVAMLMLALVTGPLSAQARYLNPSSGRFQTMDKGRLEALCKQEGKTVCEMVLFQNNAGKIHSCTIYFLPQQLQIVWIE